MKLLIRKPDANEDRVCAELIYESGPVLIPYLYLEDRPGIIDLISYAIATENHPFSRDNIFVEVYGSAIRGLVIALPVKGMNRNAFHELATVMSRQPHLWGKILSLFRMMYRGRIFSHYPKLGKKELFISNLAVSGGSRRQGVASRLMSQIETNATNRGFREISLYVETDNSNAIAFYQSYGFNEQSRTDFPEHYRRYGLNGIAKMVKTVSG